MKRLRTEKSTAEEVAPTVPSVPLDLPGPSVRLGKRRHESSQSESENDHIDTESNHCSRTL